MGRVHRAIRRRGICRDPRAGQRLSDRNPFRRTARSSRRAISCSSSIRGPTRSTLACGAGAARPGDNAQVDLADPTARPLRRAAQEGLRRRRATTTSACHGRARCDGRGRSRARRRSRSAELNLEFTRITAPVTGRISNHQVSLGNLVIGGDRRHDPALTTIVSLDPIYFYFDMSEGDYLAYQRAAAAGELDERRATASCPSRCRLIDETDWTLKGPAQLRRQPGRPRRRDDPRARRLPQPRFLHDAGQFGRVRVPASEPLPGDSRSRRRRSSPTSRAKLVMTVKDDGTVEPKRRASRPDRPMTACASSASGLAPTTASSSTGWCGRGPAPR